MGKKFKEFALALCGLMCFSESNAEVVITEIMPCNIATYLNKEKDFTGWVELYNDGTKNVNLKGWTFTNYNKKKSGSTENVKWSWSVSEDLTIEAGKYMVIPFDGFQPNERDKYHETHAPYKVDADGGSLEISDNKSYDYALKYPQMKPHISYGSYDGEVGYMVPTPGEANKTAFPSLADDQCATPTFSGVTPGVFPNSTKEDGKKIKLACATSGVTIRYSLDGSIPTEKSDAFKADTFIKLDATRIIRARAFKSGKLPSDVLTGSFIIYSSSRGDCSGEDPAVISLVTDDDFFNDPVIGMCVGPDNSQSGIPGAKNCIASAANYNRDWQRGVNFEYFEEGTPKICQEAVVGIMGGCSREHQVKSLKLTTNKRTGNETFNYKIFKNEETKKDNIYSSFQIRNGGNGYDDLLCRDGFIQNIAKGMGNIDYQAYIPVSYYINGKYKGMMGLRERTNESYIKSNYGLDEDKIDIVEFSEKKIEAGCGDLNAYNEMYAFVTDSVNYKKDNFVALLDNYMDVEEYMNYMIFEQFIVNTDWPGNNQKAWRKHIGGKFRWILYDTDFGLGRFGYDGSNYTYKELNTVKWCTGEGEHNWANDLEYEWKTKFFKCLMKNQQFRDAFMTQALILFNGPLSASAIEKVRDEFIPTVEKEHCISSKTEGRKNLNDAAGKIKDLTKFAKERIGIYKNDLAKYCKLDTNKVVVLKLVTKGDNKSEVKGFNVNSTSISGNSYTMKCLKGMNMAIKANISEGFIPSGWSVTTSDTTLSYKSQTLNLTMEKDTVTVTLNVKEESYDKPTIVINELCARNNIFTGTGCDEPEDWIELYNTGNDYVDIAGFYLSDNDTTVRIASGYEMTNIPPKGHLLLWADGRGKSGAQHLDFKLNAYGETLTLVKKVKDSVILVDKVKYGENLKFNYSYGRTKDGATTFTTFAACENSDFSEATPGEENGKYNCETIIDDLTYTVNLACSFDRAEYNVNGKEIGPNNVTTYILKGKSLTLSPVLPKKAEFVRWELSESIESYDSLLKHETSWKYHYADSQPAGNWTALAYNDAKWTAGNGYMGFDEGNKERGFTYDTKIPYNKKGGELGDSAKYMTAYFRCVLPITDTAGIKSISATMLYDDGAAIYLNGKELGRYNMPTDTTLSYETASKAYIDDQKAEFKIDPKSLKIGENIIAVEVHQYDRASSDLTFNLYAKAKMASKICKERTFTITPTKAFKATLFIQDNTEVEPINGASENILSFYPNPTSNVIHVQTGEESSLVTVCDLMGRLLIMQVVTPEEEVIDLSRLSAGTYIVTATTNGERATAKVIKK